MPILFWLALLLGYLTGVAAAVLLLPARLIEPLYGPLALTTVLALAAFGAAAAAAPGQAARRQRGAAPRQEPPPGPRRSRSRRREPDAQAGGGASCPTGRTSARTSAGR